MTAPVKHRLAVAALALALAACQPVSGEAPPPSPPPTAQLPDDAAACTHIVDADTFDITYADGLQVRVRLTGHPPTVDAYETRTGPDTTQAGAARGRQGTDRMSQFLGCDTTDGYPLRVELVGDCGWERACGIVTRDDIDAAAEIIIGECYGGYYRPSAPPSIPDHCEDLNP